MEALFGANFLQRQAKPRVLFVWRGGPRYVQCDGRSNMHVRRVSECDVVTWKTPAKQELALYVMAPCPNCGYILPLKLGQGCSFKDEMLTFSGVLQCPGHWQEVDANGRQTGKTVRCGWVGVIRDGHAHNPRCTHANFKEAHGPEDWQTCQCGGVISDEAKEVEADQIARMSQGGD